MEVRTRRATVFGLTFVVAFCSIVYELIYSELLTVVFGGTVLRYSITIGLFLFSLGVGAFLFRYLAETPPNFFRIEVLLALSGPLGLLFIIAVNALPGTDAALPRPVALVLSHLPIVVVGLLSGLEVPFLTALLDEETDSLLSVLGVSPGGAIRRVLSVAFVTRDPDAGPRTDGGTPGDAGGADDRPIQDGDVVGGDSNGAGDDGDVVGGDSNGAGDDGDVVGGDGNGAGDDGFSEILGMDYIGSLAGTVVWALVLYPGLGLIPSVFVLGLLNALAAVVFWWGFPAGGRVALAAAVVLTAVYGGVLVQGEDVERELTEVYLENRMEQEYFSRDMEINVTDHFTTRYQSVTIYERRWTGDPRYYEGSVGPETCLRLDMQVQLCESWVDSYHSGLVDVPASFYGNLSDERVLLVGGGDFIAANYLRDYGVAVDQVDVDREFMAFARNSSFVRQYNDRAWTYDRLNVVVADAYNYLRETDRQYDLVLLDLPGARDDDLLKLYSVEFYQLIRQHLTDDGLVVTWAYSRYTAPEHHKAYMNTVHEAGFTRFARYRAHDDLDSDGDYEAGEIFYVLSPGHTPELRRSNVKSEYVRRHWNRYRNVKWRPVPTFRGVAPNRVFHPNYDIIVDYHD